MIPNDDSLVIKLYYARDVKSYAVEHYKQNADGTYPLAATESDTGLSGLSRRDTATYTPKKLRGGRVHVRRGTDDAGRADRDSERRQRW